jgi:hypothetical protein
MIDDTEDLWSVTGAHFHWKEGEFDESIDILERIDLVHHLDPVTHEITPRGAFYIVNFHEKQSGLDWWRRCRISQWTLSEGLRRELGMPPLSEDRESRATRGAQGDPGVTRSPERKGSRSKEKGSKTTSGESASPPSPKVDTLQATKQAFVRDFAVAYGKWRKALGENEHGSYRVTPADKGAIKHSETFPDTRTIEKTILWLSENSLAVTVRSVLNNWQVARDDTANAARPGPRLAQSEVKTGVHEEMMKSIGKEMP